MALVGYTREGGLGIIRIDNPPVNAIGPILVTELGEALDTFDRDSEAEALVIECAGSTFIAGGDIAAFDDPKFSTGPFNRVLMRLMQSERPLVVSLFGTVLGGGLELAMACHYRVAAYGTRFGMPEVTLGLIPGSLGTQLLPRLVGLHRAAEMISDGRPVDVERARQDGLVDRVVADSDADARAVAMRLVGDVPRRTDKLRVPDASAASAVLEELRSAAEKTPWLATPRAIHSALSASVHEPFYDALATEASLFQTLVDSPQSKALRHLFFAEREAGKIPGLAADTETRDISSIGVIGAGTMGSGIATAFLGAGFSVTLVDNSEAGLARGQDIVAANQSSAVRRGRISEQEAKANLVRLTGSSDIAAVSGCDLVIEAVFEDMALKLDVARQLGEACKPGAIIATNTSTLDVDRIAAATGRPCDVLGTHFFSPAHIMRLLEVVRGAETAPDTLQTATKIARRIRKTAVVSGVCYGFIGNRMAEVYMRENEAMQLEGATPSQIDGVAQSPSYLGMAMGPNRMLDMAGIDVGASTVIEWIKSGAGPQDPAYRALCQALYEQGRNGQKTGAGYYRYEDRKPVPSPATEELAAALAQTHGVARRETIPEDEILERLLYPLVNEAARILDEGVAYRPGDIDVVWTAGYGFPNWRGGPVFMADEIGLAHIVTRLDHYAEHNGNAYGYWTVSPLLRRLAESDQRLTDWRPGVAKGMTS